MTAAPVQSFQTFREVGCVQCHVEPVFAVLPTLARGAGFYQRCALFPAAPLVNLYKLLDAPGCMVATGQAPRLP